MVEIKTGIYRLNRDSSDDVFTFDDGDRIFHLRLNDNTISCAATPSAAGPGAAKPAPPAATVVGECTIKKTDDFEYTTEDGQVLVISPDFSEIEVIEV